MIELKHDSLRFHFPEVHPECKLEIEFQRTLRIPDDGRTYPLPAGLGRFPLRHVDDFASTAPARWLDRGGVAMPMYQSEAMWISFHPGEVESRGTYCFAVKIATGKVNAVSGEEWTDGIHRDPQDYMTLPRQPWLDGYCIEKGKVRQFVAMPLGAGYTAEEQITGEAEWGGLQIVVYPMKREVFERLHPEIEIGRRMLPIGAMGEVSIGFSNLEQGMGLAPGGQMKQEIYDDPFDFDDWDLRHRSRCFVHLANSLVWREMTGSAPPHTPATSKQYSRAGIPWFDYYSEGQPREGSKVLNELKSVKQLGDEKGEKPLPDNTRINVDKIVPLRRTGLVREF